MIDVISIQDGLLSIRLRYTPGDLLGYSIEQVSTGKFFDFATAEFVDHSPNLIGKMKERWKDHDHDGDGRIDPNAGDADIKFLRGVYANTAAAASAAAPPEPEIHGVAFDEVGAFVVYIFDLRDSGRTLATAGFAAHPGEEGCSDWPDDHEPAPRPNIVVNVPKDLNINAKITFDLGHITVNETA